MSVTGVGAGDVIDERLSPTGGRRLHDNEAVEDESGIGSAAVSLVDAKRLGGLDSCAMEIDRETIRDGKLERCLDRLPPTYSSNS